MMKTRIKNLLLLLTLLFLLPAAEAQFTFTTNNGAITITGYNTAAGLNVVIPNTTNGYPVTSIAANAFFRLTTITNVNIGTNVTSIGRSAFDNCSSLTNVTIPNSVTNIGADSFLFCTNLTSVAIPNSVINIGDSAFSDCTSLTSASISNGVTSIGVQAFADCAMTNITIPDSVTNIGLAAFGGCSALTNIAVGLSNLAYSSLNGVLFDKGQKSLLQFPGGVRGSYTIPNNVISLGDQAFISCKLKSVAMPNSLTNIGSYTFYGCTNLTSVSIDNGIANIGAGSFLFCPSLFSIIIPASVTNIADSAFNSCSKLTEVYFQGNAPKIVANAFSGVNSNLTVYHLPNATGWGATFGGFPTAITPLPNGLTSVGSLPAVFYPPLGTNYTLQMSTNPASGNWVTVSNSVVLNALQVTNLANTAFFRLQDTSGSVPSPTIVSYGNQPVWIYPTNATYSLQMKTNLASTNWLAATNGNLFISVQITNAPANAVFRLH